MNDVQLATAQRLGISQIADRGRGRSDARKTSCTSTTTRFTGCNISPTPSLILFPRAQRLLNEISRCFIDSLQRKGYPFHKIIVSSGAPHRQGRNETAPRQQQRVGKTAATASAQRSTSLLQLLLSRCRRKNDKGERRIYDGRLKDILSEVLRDQRMMGTCYVRYESRQACFHITAR